VFVLPVERGSQREVDSIWNFQRILTKLDNAGHMVEILKKLSPSGWLYLSSDFDVNLCYLQGLFLPRVLFIMRRHDCS
jgi:hypothetical protein